MLAWPARLASLAMLSEGVRFSAADLVARDLIRSEHAKCLVAGFTDAKGGAS